MCVVLETTLGLVSYNEHPSLPAEIKTVMIWHLFENSFQVWSPKIDHCVCAFVELLDLTSSLCSTILDVGHLKEGTKEPVNLQGFFSPK